MINQTFPPRLTLVLLPISTRRGSWTDPHSLFSPKTLLVSTSTQILMLLVFSRPVEVETLVMSLKNESATADANSSSGRSGDVALGHAPPSYYV